MKLIDQLLKAKPNADNGQASKHEKFGLLRQSCDKLNSLSSMFIELLSKHRKKTLIAASFLTIGVGSLALTNPKESSYKAYASNWLQGEIANNCDVIHGGIKLHAGVVGMPLSDVCSISVGSFAGKRVAKLIVDIGTKEPKNLGVASIYTTEIFGVGTYRAIGIGGQFIPLP